MHIAMSQAFDSATLQQYSARSARRHKAWGVSPRTELNKEFQPAKAGDSVKCHGRSIR